MAKSENRHKSKNYWVDVVGGKVMKYRKVRWNEGALFYIFREWNQIYHPSSMECLLSIHFVIYVKNRPEWNKQNWIINTNISKNNEPKTTELLQWEYVGNIHHILRLHFLTAGELLPYRIKQFDQFLERIGSMDTSEKFKRTAFPWSHSISPDFSHCSLWAKYTFGPTLSYSFRGFFWVVFVMCSILSHTLHLLQHARLLAKHFPKFHCLHRFFLSELLQKEIKTSNSVSKHSFQMYLYLTMLDHLSAVYICPAYMASLWTFLYQCLYNLI